MPRPLWTKCKCNMSLNMIELSKASFTKKKGMYTTDYNWIHLTILVYVEAGKTSYEKLHYFHSCLNQQSFVRGFKKSHQWYIINLCKGRRTKHQSLICLQIDRNILNLKTYKKYKQSNGMGFIVIYCCIFKVIWLWYIQTNNAYSNMTLKNITNRFFGFSFQTSELVSVRFNSAFRFE